MFFIANSPSLFTSNNNRYYYEQIEGTDRFYPSIFRVGYYGNYGREFKNKDFVYRGDVLEVSKRKISVR